MSVVRPKVGFELSDSMFGVQSDSFEHTSSSYNNTFDEVKPGRIVLDIVDNILEDKRGAADISTSSFCSSDPIKDKKPKLDRRLAYWKKTLEDRREIQKRIAAKVGKRPDEILFNRSTTLDDRNKRTVQTVMDYAYRLSPDQILNRKTLKLKEKCHPPTCRMTIELEETLPKAEKERCKFVEITGLPNNIKVELLGRLKEQGVEKEYLWLHSDVLKSRIHERRKDVERVVEFYPDIDNLEIVGEGILPPRPPAHVSDINLLKEISIHKISSDTISANICEDEPTSSSDDCIPEYAIKINDQVFKMAPRKCDRIIETKTFFMCEPFETSLRTVIHLENVGKQVLDFEWISHVYYEKNGRFLQPESNEFNFNRVPFRLFSRESRDVVVAFQPRTVQIVKEKWFLKISPQFFCKKVEAVTIKLHGKCTPPNVYACKLYVEQTQVLEKSNMAMMRKLTTTMASITPLIQPPERVCPYQRILEEREIFELENPGYKCDRFQDLELLKALYQKVKKPREHSWDLRLDTLRNMILRLEGADRRALTLDEMLGIIQTMRGTPVSLDEKALDRTERNKTCLIHVKGIICATIDDWEDILGNIENSFFKPMLANFNAEVEAMQEEQAKFEGEEEEEWDYKTDLYVRLIEAGEEAIQTYVTKRVRQSKAFRDSAFIQTYSLLCNIAEDIVSIIESTDVF